MTLLPRRGFAEKRAPDRWRTIFSVITTESSITRPMAIAIAPRVIRLKVWPIRYMAKTLMASVSGIDDALMAVIRA